MHYFLFGLLLAYSWPTLGQGFATSSSYNKTASHTKKGPGRYHRQDKAIPKVVPPQDALSTLDMTGAVV